MLRIVLFLLFVICAQADANNVIFIHPDGAGVSNWQAARFYWAGPDAELNWDRIPQIAVYRGHMADSLSATSNGGATSHAYGIKVPSAAFGTDGKSGSRPKAANGETGSLMHEAMRRGVRTGLVNSGSIIEPGTACFVASTAHRDDYEQITEQVVESGVDVILSGGEEWFLPPSQAGRHVKAGRRTDGRDLIEEARKKGYTVVFNRTELESVTADTTKLLGIFAEQDTFNDMEADKLKALGLPTYAPEAPTLQEMTAAALRILAPGPFFLVVEEEGTDNFANFNNAPGVLDALKRADDAFGTALEFVEKHPETLLITAADSSAGSMDVLGFPPKPELIAKASSGRDANGAPYGLTPDGQPFLSKPDRSGEAHPFVITWGTLSDASGGILVRAAGKNADQVKGSFDNTKIYSLMHEVLFEESVPRGGRTQSKPLSDKDRLHRFLGVLFPQHPAALDAETPTCCEAGSRCRNRCAGRAATGFPS
ncbi:MAG: alkaline phosphatase [bacterium]